MGQIPNNSRPSDLNGVEDSHIVQYFIFHSSIYVGSSLLYPTILRFAHDGLGHTSFPLLLSSPGNQHDPSLKYSHNGSGPHCSGNKFQIGCSIPFSRFILSPACHNSFSQVHYSYSLNLHLSIRIESFNEPHIFIRSIKINYHWIVNKCDAWRIPCFIFKIFPW